MKQKGFFLVSTRQNFFTHWVKKRKKVENSLEDFSFCQYHQGLRVVRRGTMTEKLAIDEKGLKVK